MENVYIHVSNSKDQLHIIVFVFRLSEKKFQLQKIFILFNYFQIAFASLHGFLLTIAHLYGPFYPKNDKLNVKLFTIVVQMIFLFAIFQKYKVQNDFFPNSKL